MPEVTREQKIEVSIEEWNTEGVARFGEDQFHWRFRCPVCGNVQTPEDFRPFKDAGANPNSAYQQCIGRFTPDPYRAFGENPKGKPKTPCDYAAFGLLPVGLRLVRTSPDKQPQRVFPFAEPPEIRETVEP